MEAPLKPIEQSLQRELLGDVEVEPAARVLDQLSPLAGAGRLDALGLGREPVEAVTIEDHVPGAGGGRGEVPEPGGEQGEPEVEDLGPTPSPRSLRLVGDLPGRAPDAGGLLLLQRLASRLLDAGAGLLRRLQQPLPGGRPRLSADRRRGAPLRAASTASTGSGANSTG
jgi:hypothetical protein